MTDREGIKLSDDLPYDSRFDEHVLAIGRVAMIWSQFEFFVSETIWELANLDRSAGACLTAQMIGPNPRFKALVALMHFRKANQNLIDEMNSLSGTAQGLGERRNRIVHDPWSISDWEGIRRLHVKADRKLEFEFKPDPIPELNKAYTDIIRLIQDFEDLRERMFAELPPFSRTQYEQSPGIRTRPRAKGTGSSEQTPPPEPSQE